MEHTEYLLSESEDFSFGFCSSGVDAPQLGRYTVLSESALACFVCACVVVRTQYSVWVPYPGF